MDDIGRLSTLGFNVSAEIMLERSRTGFHTSETVLCLGAGQAYPELQLINSLKIPHENAVFLDRNFSLQARKRLGRLAPKAKLVESGMFAYLEGAQGEHFSLVTTFGLHDVLADRATFEKFLTLIPGVLDKSAIAVILHSFGGAEAISMAYKHSLAPVLGNYNLFIPMA